MTFLARSAGLALALILGLSCAQAAEPGKPDCLGEEEARALVQAGEVMPMSEVLMRARRPRASTIVSVELCRKGQKLVYVFAIMSEGGRVRRVEIDATPPRSPGPRT